MNLKEYRMQEPGAETPVGIALRALAAAKPYRASRLVSALDEFVVTELDVAYRVLPEEPGGSIEIYIVPPRYVLIVPDAAALIRVNHIKAMVDIILIIEEYGESKWPEVRRFAIAALLD